MQPAPPTPNEARRLEALASYDILDTAPEQAYDDITQLASQICGAPIALVSLIDQGRQWFKARNGIAVSETPRDLAFCSHAIHGSQPLIVPDASQDDRFSDNPLVTADPHIRFYAGAPLIMPDGNTLGTLCVIDRTPRDLSGSQLAALQALARQVVWLLELRRVAKDLASALAEVKTLRAILPVCAYCRKVRDDQGYWSEVGSYLKKQAGVDFSHGICLPCRAIHFPDYPDSP